MNNLKYTIAILLLLLVSNSLCGQKTARVEKGNLPVKVSLPGVFVADDKSEIKMEPSEYRGELIVTRILHEGAVVKKGDMLIEFDTDKLDEAIETAQNDATDTDVQLKKAIAEYESAKVDLESKIVAANVELSFLEKDVLAAIEKQAMEMEKKLEEIDDAKIQLANQRVDMDTLVKIYQERKLETSHSGEILIAREKAGIANKEKSLTFKQKQLDYFKKFDKSKDQLKKELDVDKKKAAIAKMKINLQATVTEKKSLVDKAQRKFDTASKKLAGLKQDRDQLRVVSPRDGVLFYGQTGQELPAGLVVMTNMPDARKSLRIGGRVRTHRILLTVAKMKNLSIKLSVAEDDIQHLKKDLKTTIYPDAFPKESFAGVLTKVDQIATKVHFSSSKRRFKVMAKCTDDATQLRAGMNCRVEIHCAGLKDILRVPVSAIFQVDDEYVCYVDKNGSAEKRIVKIGQSNPTHVEIISGLREGESVLLQRP